MMKKINVSLIFRILREIVKNASVIFVVVVFTFGAIGSFLGQSVMTIIAVYMCFIYALLIAASYKVYAIKVLPIISKHILFFALMYIGFIFIFMPTVNTNISSQTTLYLTVAYIVIYLICFGIVQFIKYIIRGRIEKKQNYENQFNKLKK